MLAFQSVGKSRRFRNHNGAEVSRLIQAVLCASLFAGNIAGAQTADTVNGPKPLFRLGDLVTVGAFTLATIALAPADRHMTHQLQVPARQSNRLLNRGASIFRILGSPGGLITGTGLYLLGTADGQRRTQDLGLHTVEAIALADGVTESLKILAGRARPRISGDDASKFQLLRGLRNEDYRSFPSGHATSAFAFASAVSSETQRWWPSSRWILGPILYSGATLTGVSRIYNNAHWASDVMAGAAIGTLVGLKVVRYQHSHPDNYLDRKLLRAGVMHVNGGGWTPTLSTVVY
jgi:membrane-associated phospholipid phosphatase